MSQQMANAPQSPGGPSGFPDESSDLGTQFISSKNSDLPSAEEEIASLLATELLQVKQSIKNVKHKIKRAIRHPHI
jgi:hypothetical protein